MYIELLPNRAFIFISFFKPLHGSPNILFKFVSFGINNWLSFKKSSFTIFVTLIYLSLPPYSTFKTFKIFSLHIISLLLNSFSQIYIELLFC